MQRRELEAKACEIPTLKTQVHELEECVKKLSVEKEEWSRQTEKILEEERKNFVQVTKKNRVLSRWSFIKLNISQNRT